MSLALVGQQQSEASCKCIFLNVIDSLAQQIRLRVTDIETAALVIVLK